MTKGRPASSTCRESSRRALSRHVDDAGRPFVIRYREGGGFAPVDQPGRTYRQLVPAGTLPRDWFTVDFARKSQRTGYPTQKPEALLARLIAASSEPGDLVADLFAGSGTAPAVAAGLGRRWLAGDDSPAAIAATRRRLLARADRGGGFEVAALEDAMPPPASLDLVIRRVPGARPADASSLEIDGSNDALRDVVAWAVGTRRGALVDPFVARAASAHGAGTGPFMARATAARDARTGEMATTLPRPGRSQETPAARGRPPAPQATCPSAGRGHARVPR